MNPSDFCLSNLSPPQRRKCLFELVSGFQETDVKFLRQVGEAKLAPGGNLCTGAVRSALAAQTLR